MGRGRAGSGETFPSAERTGRCPGCEGERLSVEMCGSEAGAFSFSSFSHQVGAVAQLGERLHGMQEVTSSILVSSTLFVARQRTRFRSSAPSGRASRGGRFSSAPLCSCSRGCGPPRERDSQAYRGRVPHRRWPSRGVEGRVARRRGSAHPFEGRVSRVDGRVSRRRGSAHPFEGRVLRTRGRVPRVEGRVPRWRGRVTPG